MICLDYRHAKLWCCEDISKIENYDKANKEAHSFLGENNPMYGKHHSAEARRKMSVAKIGLYKDIPRSGSRWVKYGMTRNAIMKKLHLGRKQVEQLDKDNKLIEVINELD